MNLFRFPFLGRSAVQRPINLDAIEHTLSLFLRVCGGLAGVDRIGSHDAPHKPPNGSVGLELRDVAGAGLEVPRGNGLVFGTTPEEQLVGGDFPTHAVDTVGRDLATCLCDVAIQFRGPSGGVVLDPATRGKDLVESANRGRT